MCIRDRVETLPSDHELPEWSKLPGKGGFAATRVGSRTDKIYVTDAEKRNQSESYAKYQKWAEESCGVTDVKFRQLLEIASSTKQTDRGRLGIPLCLRRKNLTVRSYAVLLCRVAGLRQAVATEALVELGGEEFATRALRELERILSLGDCAMEKERAALGLALVRPDSNNVPTGATYRSGAWVPAFFFLCGFG